MATMNNQSMHVQNALFKHFMYIKLGMIFVVLGIINFVVGYMYFPEIWIKTLSSSTILVLLGVGIMCVYEEKVRKLGKRFA